MKIDKFNNKIIYYKKKLVYTKDLLMNIIIYSNLLVKKIIIKIVGQNQINVYKKQIIWNRYNNRYLINV